MSKNRKYFFAAVLTIFTSIYTLPANAFMATSESGGTGALISTPSPSPSPGISPVPANNVNQINSSPFSAISKVGEAVSVAIANRATGTPGLLDGPREAIANIGVMAK